MTRLSGCPWHLLLGTFITVPQEESRTEARIGQYNSFHENPGFVPWRSSLFGAGFEPESMSLRTKDRSPSMGNGPGSLTRPAFVRDVRKALANLHDVPCLRTLPLAQVIPVDAFPGSRQRGEFLQRALLEAIEALRPPAHSSPTDRATRRYRLLKLRFRSRESREAVQSVLAISRTHYFRESQSAVEEVAALLWERWELDEGKLAPLAGAHRSPAAAGRAAAGKLRVALSRFVGRAREVQELGDLLRARLPLITLVGPPGVGKTRLALEVAAQTEGLFAGGVHCVALGDVSHPNLVPSAIVSALEVHTESTESVSDVLARALHQQQVLLILDTFEHLVAMAPQVASLLQACPSLQILATSRVPLRIRGEREFPVRPLPLPAARADPSTLVANEAVQLFLDRVRATDPRVPTDPNALRDVAEICRRLDGLPLAIELAAARVKVLPPHAMLSRLGQRPSVLISGPRDLPERQRSLDAAIGWSYELLDEAAQSVFRRLGVFSGGCRIEAAEAVIDPGVDVIGRLAELVDSSLLYQLEDDGEPRFRMLDTIREFARDRLNAKAEAQTVALLHAAYFLKLAEAVDAMVTAQHRILAQEHDNLQAALQTYIDFQDAEGALRLSTVLALYGYERGFYEEGRAAVQAALALPQAAERARSRARALLALAGLARHQGDDGTALALAEEAHRIAIASGDHGTTGWALEELGRLANRALDWTRAHTLLEESLAIARQCGDQLATARCLGIVGGVAHALGDHPRATAAWTEARALYRDLGVRSRYAMMLRHLANLGADLGDYQQARTLVVECLTVAQDLGPFWMAAGLECLVGLAVDEQQPIRAIRLAAAAARIRNEAGVRMPMQWESSFNDRLEWARRVLGEQSSAQAWAEGLGLSGPDLMHYALETNR
jgi:predicted ATPase